MVGLFMLFIGSLNSTYSANILPGNQSNYSNNNQTFANTSTIFFNQSSAFYGSMNSSLSNITGGGSGSSAPSTSNWFFLVVPGSQQIWNGITMIFTILTGSLSLVSDLVVAFSVAGFPQGGTLIVIIGVMITIYILLEVFGWWGKYKLQ